MTNLHILSSEKYRKHHIWSYLNEQFLELLDSRFPTHEYVWDERIQIIGKAFIIDRLHTLIRMGLVPSTYIQPEDVNLVWHEEEKDISFQISSTLLEALNL